MVALLERLIDVARASPRSFYPAELRQFTSRDALRLHSLRRRLLRAGVRTHKWIHAEKQNTCDEYYGEYFDSGFRSHELVHLGSHFYSLNNSLMSKSNRRLHEWLKSMPR